MKNSTILHEITPDEISSLFQELKNEIQELKHSFQAKPPEDLMTRKEVARMFRCDLSTIHNWVKKGKLKPYGKGNKVYFKRSEVEATLVPLNCKK